MGTSRTGLVFGVFGSVVLALSGMVTAAAPSGGDPGEILPQSAVVVVRMTRLQERWDAFLGSRLFRRLENAPIAGLTKGIQDIRQGVNAIEAQIALDGHVGKGGRVSHGDPAVVPVGEFF